MFSDDSKLDLKWINLPNEIIHCLESEEDLAEVLDSSDNIEELTMAHKQIASYENLNINTTSNESLQSDILSRSGIHFETTCCVCETYLCWKSKM